jgi:hypothetical protein
MREMSERLDSWGNVPVPSACVWWICGSSSWMPSRERERSSEMDEAELSLTGVSEAEEKVCRGRPRVKSAEGERGGETMAFSVVSGCGGW